jgi:hypothetical protein
MIHPCPEIQYHWWSWYPPVGIFIAIVTLFTYLYDRKHPASTVKITRTVIVTLLVLLEIRSIKLDQKRHDEEQAIAHCELLNNFEAIANKLKQDADQNKLHFDQTMEQEKGILATAREVEELSLDNLKNITGGESFGYAVPFSTQADTSTLILRNDGDHVLTGVTVIVEQLLNGCLMEPNAKCVPRFDTGMMQPIDMGTLGPHQRKPIPRHVIFDPTGAGSSVYFIRVNAQNGQAIEQIQFRRSSVHQGYAYSFKVVRTFRGKPSRSDFKLGNEEFRTLRTEDWTEYSPSESEDGIHPYIPR